MGRSIYVAYLRMNLPAAAHPYRSGAGQRHDGGGLCRAFVGDSRGNRDYLEKEATRATPFFIETCITEFIPARVFA